MARSKALFEQAVGYIPGGVNSPVRAFRGVDSTPLFIRAGQGPYLIDEDGREYVDYVGSWGPLILGHAHPNVIQEVTHALHRGFSFGAPTEVEVRLAEKVCQFMPSIEQIRFVNSGTEATMSAIRLARGFTKRNKIIKFAGCYHGHSDGLLVSAGSGVLTLGIPSSAGVPDSVIEHTLVAEYNSLEQVAALFEKYSDDIAAIIVEPIAANMNLVLPTPEFLPGLRELCNSYNSLLIFDEVVTGFRVGLGGAQEYYRIVPDLTVLGKIIGGGFPVGAFGGRREIMGYIAPLGPVYQAGTLSGNPIAMTAGLATLKLLSVSNFYANLKVKTEKLLQGLRERADAAKVSFSATSVGSMFGLYFTESKKIEKEADVKQCNIAQFKRFFHGMLNEGIYFGPSAFEVGFVSAVHAEKEMMKTLRAAEKVFTHVKEKEADRVI